MTSKNIIYRCSFCHQRVLAATAKPLTNKEECPLPNDRIDRSTQQKTHGAQRRQALYNIAGQASHAINDIFNEQLRRLYGAQWEEEASSRAIDRCQLNLMAAALLAARALYALRPEDRDIPERLLKSASAFEALRKTTDCE